MTPAPNSNGIGSAAPRNATPSRAAPAPVPRAFAQGAGLVFQTAGLLVALSTCCVGSFVGLIQRPNRTALASRPAQTVLGAWRSFQTHEKLATLSVLSNCIAGLALAAAGIGLQYDRAASPRLATAAALPLAAFHWVYLALLVARGPRSAWMIVPAALALMWTGFSLLALLSLQQHRAHPPPRGMDKLPPDYNLPATAGERMYREWVARRQSGGQD